MSSSTVMHDERTVAVENASYRLGYLFVTFGLLVLVAYRSFVPGQASWDLLALVVASGVITTLVQGQHGILTTRWARSARSALIAVLAAGVAAVGLTVVASSYRAASEGYEAAGKSRPE